MTGVLLHPYGTRREEKTGFFYQYPVPSGTKKYANFFV